ncbi:hypothetical protein SAMN05444748_102466 [Variovorax sp. OV700]|jgi:hypothetical protein|nr:hypothetical protein SAMN05444748_102466 [Variovorax sp. OV700]
MGRRTINNAVMKRLSDSSQFDRSIMRLAFERLERIAASALLFVGAAALIGWIVVELYVTAVTAD